MFPFIKHEDYDGTSFPSMDRDTLPIGFLCCKYVISLSSRWLKRGLTLTKVKATGVKVLREDIIKPRGENVAGQVHLESSKGDQGNTAGELGQGGEQRKV